MAHEGTTKMRNQMLLASIATALLGACVGGIDTPPNTGGDDDDMPSGETPRQLFDRTVSPLLGACVSCHVGPELSATNMFLGPDGLSSAYDTLVKDRAVNGGFDPAAATLLLKGAHEGPAWSPGQADKIATWLRAELEVRGPTTPDPNPTGSGTRSARTAMMMFAACMSVSLTDFTTGKAYSVANMNTQNQGACTSCHGQGAGGVNFTLTNQYKDMFAKWQEEIYFTGVFSAALQPDLTYKIVAAETKICNKGKEKNNNLGTHPEFNCQQNNSTALNALKAFVTIVQTKVDMHDPTCPTPAFAMPTP
jgi:cytochrome c553